jgi:hypothetical protein
MNTTNALTAPITVQCLGPSGELYEVDLPPAEVLALAAGRGELPEPIRIYHGEEALERIEDD